MENSRFDELSRQLARRLPRRGVLGLAATLTVAGVLGASEEGDARRKQRRKKCPTGQRRCGHGSRQRCVGCCSDADCGGNACTGGECASCPNGQRSCRGGCIAVTACCADADCSGGRVCVDGTCDCRASERLCEGTCIPRDACCGADCPSTTCNSTNCNGCCDGNTCRQGDSQNFCGRGGVACTPCGSGAACDAGVCVCSGGRVSCADGSCISCRSGETCGAGNTCECPTACCGDEDCTAGDAGLCQPDGTCVYRPNCTGGGKEVQLFGCNGQGGPQSCCAGECNVITDLCGFSGTGQRCRIDNDCKDQQCRYYRCV